MDIDELKRAVLAGDWPDRELVFLMVVPGDPDIEVCEYEVQVGVGFLDFSDGTTAFPCKFDDDPELFILVHEDGKFWFKGEECWIKEKKGS